MPKKIIAILFSFIFIVFGILVLGYLFLPFAIPYITNGYPIGDEPMHFANILLFQHFHPFPVAGWQGQWLAGYPLVEGYPWLHYYLVLPLGHFLGNLVSAMDYYAIVGLFLYIASSFLLFLYVSKNKFFALLLSIILLYGTDTGIILFFGGYFVFAVSQFFMPLVLLLVIIAREKNSRKILYMASIALSLALAGHATLTYALIIPAILPFLLTNKESKISFSALIKTLKFFAVFALLSSVNLFQQIELIMKGINVSQHSTTPLDQVAFVFTSRFSMFNPVLLIFAIAFILILITNFKKSSNLKPYFVSFLLMCAMFVLMVFGLSSFATILFPERTVWVVSLTFLTLVAAQMRYLDLSKKKSLILGFISLASIGLYLYLMLFVKSPLLLPKSLKEKYTPTYLKTGYSSSHAVGKYKADYTYPPLSWNQGFENYRIDSLDYNLFAWGNLISPNQRFNGWYTALKGMPLAWSGYVAMGLQGRNGEGGAYDNSEIALNRNLFFLDWYGIGHIQSTLGEKAFGLHLAEYMKIPPIIKDKEKSDDLLYYNIDKDLISPIYSPTNAKTLAVVSSEENYDNFIRTLSFTKFSSKRLIPLYLGNNLGNLKKEDLKYYDAIYLYGYKSGIFGPGGSWNMLSDFVKNGGDLFIETGQKVDETSKNQLPSVFPIQGTSSETINEDWNVKIENESLIKGVESKYLNPLHYKYLPYTISKAQLSSVKDWAKPVLNKEDSTVFVYGELGQGKVAWSGLNLPFQVADTRNIAEIKITENVFNWFFPDIPQKLTDFTVKYPKPEEISVSGKGGRGVLFKENYDDGWSASINGNGAKIYKAGLFLMYIPLPDQEKEFTVELNYNGNPVYWALFIEAALVLLLTLLYLVFSLNFLKFLEKLKLPKFHIQMKSWWDKDKEEDY